ncbi:ABC transporter permease [Streptomyces sp. Je 1-4]|uniref:ABC transporter permease n=1 Tax=Streptomyces TaxID=1883 RepID=UPI0021D9D11D|nr:MULTISPECIES: ABC transporter permease [unclassified Streptomyces]UYB42718.1 ABC transporter permease [Streptomyces sp. Je 1-4]UZQ39042.1 ABC transporter permease [Streptomyces sp. Je 1-4] [Streptomyces sp. Je 1-4 4N24]UZQ46459.1 ABC transporter permease [Streptomyces sp. Je 1-4] [Streptomyces sp. Je 1-4 4N24_ara]
MLDYVRLEVRRTLRDRGFVIFGIGMPVLMYLLMTNIGVGPGGAAPEWKIASMVGMAAYGALGAAVGTGTGVAEDKQLGWLRQLRITPLSPLRVVVGRGLTGSVTVLPALASVLLVGALVNGVRMPAWQWGALAGLLWIGSAPFTLLGLGNGYRLSAQSTSVVNTGCVLLLSIIGGLWFPTELFPGWLRSLSLWTPGNRFAELGRSITHDSAPGLGSVAVLAVWLALFGGHAVYAYRRAARTV